MEIWDDTPMPDKEILSAMSFKCSSETCIIHGCCVNVALAFELELLCAHVAVCANSSRVAHACINTDSK